MPKLFVVLLFLFFTLSFARTPLTLPENDVTQIQLPSANDVIRPDTLPESTDDSTHRTFTLPSKSDAEETQTFHPVPLNFVSFRPINRRFRLRSNRPLRLCRHQPRSRHQISYGNDVILSKKVDFDKFVYRVGMSQIPADRFNDHKDMFGKMKWKNQNGFHAHHFDDDVEAEQRPKLYRKHNEDHYRKKLRKRFHHRDGDEEEEKTEEVKKWHNKEKKKGGMMRSIRKFLHHYFD